MNKHLITIDDRHEPMTVVAFSGLAPKNSMFEWVKSFSDLKCNFVGVKDPDNDWYQTRRDEIAWEVERHAPRPRMFIGASAGGFAALFFAKLLNADAVLAFCPQSACGKAKRDLRDFRWPKWCDETPACDIAGEYPNATIHYAMNDEFDVLHASRIVCRHVTYPSGGHNLPGVLKDDGRIGDIIAEAVRAV